MCNSSEAHEFSQCGTASPYCISSSLFCDKIVQCGFSSFNFGADENPLSCIREQISTRSSVTQNIIVSTFPHSENSKIVNMESKNVTKSSEPNTFFVDTVTDPTVYDKEYVNDGKDLENIPCVSTIAILTVMLVLTTIISFTFLSMRLYQRMTKNSVFWQPEDRQNNPNDDDTKTCAVISHSCQTEVPPSYDKLYPLSV